MPPTGDTESGTELLTSLTLLDLYNVPGESAEMNSEIFSAMRRGNREFFDKMKRCETPMACFKNDKGDSILHLAAAFGHVELVKDIVSACPSLLLLTNSKNQVPLHVAACGGHLAVVEALVASVTFFSAQVSKEEDRERLNVYGLKDKTGDTPLHLALKDLHEKKESLLNQHRPRYPSVSGLIKYLQRIRCSSFPDASTRLIETAVCLVNANQGASFLANSEKISPLYLAVEAGNLSLVNAMLNHLGNNVQGKTSNLASQLEGRKSLVHVALKAKNTDVLDVILNKFPSLVEEPDEEGRTSLSVGASVGFKEGVCKLLDLPTSSVFKCDKDGSYPIHRAVEKGHEDGVKELLKRFPDSIEQLNKKGQNSLHIAAKSGKATFFLMNYISRLDMKNHLIEEQDVDGNTPLHLATINWRPQSVWALTNLSSTRTKVLNIQNKEGLRALEIAELRLQPDYVLRERVTLMASSSFGARAGHSAVVEVLVASVTYFSARLTEEDKEGLNLYVLKDINGDTPLHLALKDLHEKTEVLKYQHRFRNKLPLHSVIIKWLCCKSTSFSVALACQIEKAASMVNANQRASFLANKDGISPLYMAVEAGNVSLVKAMLYCPGKTLNLASQLKGRKSLVHAALKAKNTGLYPNSAVQVSLLKESFSYSFGQMFLMFYSMKT